MTPVLSRMSSRERAEWLRVAGPRGIRLACGIPGTAIAEALGVNVYTLYSWERLERAPRGARGEAYCRVIAGLLRHLEVPEGGFPQRRPGRPCTAVMEGP